MNIYSNGDKRFGKLRDIEGLDIRMSDIKRLYTFDTGAEYCGFEDDDSKAYFKTLHKEGRGPSFVKPSDRRIFFTRTALDKWMTTWQAVER